jgi:hypothetical protein
MQIDKVALSGKIKFETNVFNITQGSLRTELPDNLQINFTIVKLRIDSVLEGLDSKDLANDLRSEQLIMDCFMVELIKNIESGVELYFQT